MTRGSLDLIGALRDPGTAHRDAYEMSINTTNPWSYALMLVAPLLALTVPLTFYYWRELSPAHRGLAIAAIAVTWASGPMLGRYKTTADLLLIGLVFAFVHLFRRTRPPSRRKCLRAIVFAVIALVLSVALFANTIGRRAPGADPGYVHMIDARANRENAFIRPFPRPIQPTIAQLYRAT